MRVVTCPYCGKNCELVSGDVIYPHRPDLVVNNYWRCAPCEAYVGCHKAGNWTYVNGERIESDGTVPFGTPANAELRAKRQEVHGIFDAFWKARNLTRTKAYTKLAQQMRRHVDTCHVAMFTLDDCKLAIFCVHKLAKKEPHNA